MTDSVATVFIAYSDRKLAEMTSSMTRCLQRLNESQVWEKQGDHENSVGNLVLHLAGNMRQWIMHGVDEQPDVRLRDAEFSTKYGFDRDTLLAIFSDTVQEARAVLATVSSERLLDVIEPQPGRGKVTVLAAIYQVIGHVQMHVGQIIVLTKQMVGDDLDLTIPRAR